jgi:hypothetical protein
MWKIIQRLWRRPQASQLDLLAAALLLVDAERQSLEAQLPISPPPKPIGLRKYQEPDSWLRQ